jgi:serine-type D-Ala-D-Ala carboxypeptidase (penicillin-binding protein 5/6)
LRNKQLTSIMLTPDYKFPGKGKSLGGKRARFATQNHNRMLGSYPGTVGVKNGFTTKARGTFVGAASRGGHTYLAVVMRSKAITPEVEALLDWAFANGARARPVGILVRPGQLSAMTGPGIATSTPEPTPTVTSSAGTKDQLRAALPTAGSSLSGPVAYFWTSGLWLLATALVLALIAVLIARRYWWTGMGGRGAVRGSSRGGRIREPGSRVQLPGGGRHRT